MGSRKWRRRLVRVIDGWKSDQLRPGEKKMSDYIGQRQTRLSLTLVKKASPDDYKRHGRFRLNAIVSHQVASS